MHIRRTQVTVLSNTYVISLRLGHNYIFKNNILLKCDENRFVIFAKSLAKAMTEAFISLQTLTSC
jgi:hypothetical protein